MKKKRFPVSGFLLVTLMMLAIFEMTAFGASSGKKTAWTCNGKAECKMEVEAGQTFYMNLLLEPCYDPMIGLSTYVRGEWKSSVKKVASVSSERGLVKAKKAGTTKISLKWEGKTYTCTLTVKKKGTLVTGDYKKLMQADKALKPYNKKVTKSNLKKALRAWVKFEKIRKKTDKKLNSDSGALKKKPNRIIYQVQNADARWKIDTAAREVLKGAFVIQSVHCNSASKMTFTLTKAVNQDQIDMINLVYPDFDYEANELEFFNMIVDEFDEDGEPLGEHSEDVSIWGGCRFKKGSNKVVYVRGEDCKTSFKKANLVSVIDDGLFRLKSEDDELRFS